MCRTAQCDALGYEGVCRGDTSVWSDGGRCHVRDCASEGKSCGFIAEGVGYGCLGGSEGSSVFDCADVVFTTLAGDQSESLILFEDSGSEATSDLIYRWDTATGLPLTPNGADVTVVPAAGGLLTA